MPRSALLRLLGYTRPYVGVVLAAVIASLVYAGARTGRVYLFKPLIDDVVIAGPEPKTSGLDRLPALHLPFVERWFGAAAAGSGGAAGGGEAAAGRAATGGGTPVVSPEPPSAATAAGRFARIMLIALVIVVVLPIAHFLQDYLIEYALGRVIIDVQSDLCAKLLALPLRFHQSTRRGDALTRIISDVRVAHTSIDILFGDVLQAAFSVATGIAVLAMISWQLTLLALAVAPALVAVVAIFGRRVRRRARKRQEQFTEVTQRLVEILSGIKVIKAFRAERFEHDSFLRENWRLFGRGMRVAKARVLSRSVVEAMTNTVGVLLLGLGAVAVRAEMWGLTPGGLAAAGAVLISTQRATRELTKGWTQLQDALPSARRFFELLDTEVGLPDAPDAVAMEGLRRDIQVSKLSFSYGREPVLRDVSFAIRAGEVVAIVGRTGAGKTTLADLILRFHDPEKGSIEIDGVDLRRITRDSLLAQVAVVTQEPFLFDGTIRDNIRYGRPDASDAEIDAAAHAAHVDEFVRTLPRGYDTPVGEAGVQLSGGQRQRITIARALIKNPSLLVFDEATSSLDAKSERLVQDAIDRLLSGRTVIVIAHRLSTIRHADKIVVLEDGAVAQVGTHAELVARGGLYRELVALQTGERPSARSGSEAPPAAAHTSS
jgi:ATP-binding cassette, subfamily B, bacterial MsbA